MSADSESSKPPESGQIILNEDLFRQSVISKNVDQEIIITTADKVRLALASFGQSYSARDKWKAPFGVFVTAVGTLVATDFKSSKFFAADVWKALFILLAVYM